MNKEDLLKQKNYLEKQLDIYQEDSTKTFNLLSELQSIEHKLKKFYHNQKKY